jgi:HNH endonuclease
MLRVVRKHLIDRAGGKCERCGWSERNPYTGQLPLEIEHIDGDWSNDDPENLAVLCPNCHALTATFKGANRGRGRPNRGRVINPISHGGRLPLTDLEEGMHAGGDEAFRTLRPGGAAVGWRSPARGA